MKQQLWAFLDPTNASASLRHLAYAVGVGSSVVWLTWSLHHDKMTQNWVWAFGIFLTAVTGAKVLGGPKVGAEAPTAPGCEAVPGSSMSASDGGTP